MTMQVVSRAQLGLPTEEEMAEIEKNNAEYMRAMAEEMWERRTDLQHLTVEQIEDQLNAGM